MSSQHSYIALIGLTLGRDLPQISVFNALQDVKLVLEEPRVSVLINVVRKSDGYFGLRTLQFSIESVVAGSKVLRMA